MSKLKKVNENLEDIKTQVKAQAIKYGDLIYEGSQNSIIHFLFDQDVFGLPLESTLGDEDAHGDVPEEIDTLLFNLWADAFRALGRDDVADGLLKILKDGF